VIMANQNANLRHYIIMPKEGFSHPKLQSNMLAPANRAVAVAARPAATTAPKMRVLDSIHEDGPKLVQMTAEGELSLRLSNPELKIVPEVFYHRCWYRPEIERAPAARSSRARVARAGAKLKVSSSGAEITITGRSSGSALKGAHVVAFTDYANRVGAEGDSGANGIVRLAIGANQKLERIYVYGPPGYWGYYTTGSTLKANKTIKLRAVDLKDAKLLLQQLYGKLPATAGAGVTVGIIDSGVDGTHPDLRNVLGGQNCVGDEVRANPAAKADWGPAKKKGEHGTHVAGIVAGNGATSGFRGVAPGAKLRSYRVFPNTGDGASNFDIARAIDAATADKCDLINLSLGGGPRDDLTQAAIDRALAAGVVVVAAAGNDGRRPVAYPAAFPECVAISAMGRRGSFPSESIGTSDIAAPKGGTSNADFIADFSNFGSEIDATGAGVEIVSTLPKGEYGPMSGTSMASPAVTGFAAYLLSQDASVRQAQGSDRSRKLKDLLYANCRPEKFGREYEGFGLPLP
jgi:subtilisin